MQLGGPIWNDKIHNVDFAKRLLERVSAKENTLKTDTRIKGILGGIIDEEIVGNKPLSFDMSQICSNIKSFNPTKQ